MDNAKEQVNEQMERLFAGLDLEAICKKLSRYCPGQRIRCKPWWDDRIRFQLTGRGSRSHWLAKETYMPDAVLKRVKEPDFPQWLADELRGQGWPIETEAEQTERRRRRHVELVQANNKRISERRRMARETPSRLVEYDHTKCHVCKTPITARRSSKCYCSARCRQWARRHWSSETRTSTDRKKRLKAVEA